MIFCDTFIIFNLWLRSPEVIMCSFFLYFSILLGKTCSSPCFILSRPNSWTRSTRYAAEFLRCFWSRSRRPWRPCLSRKWSATLGRYTDSIAESQQIRFLNDREEPILQNQRCFFVCLFFLNGTCAIPRTQCGFLTSVLCLERMRQSFLDRQAFKQWLLWSQWELDEGVALQRTKPLE